MRLVESAEHHKEEIEERKEEGRTRISLNVGMASKFYKLFDVQDI